MPDKYFEPLSKGMMRIPYSNMRTSGTSKVIPKTKVLDIVIGKWYWFNIMHYNVGCPSVVYPYLYTKGVFRHKHVAKWLQEGKEVPKEWPLVDGEGKPID